MVKTLHVQCRGCGFDPWSGNQDPTCRVARPKKQKQKWLTPGSHPSRLDSVALGVTWALTFLLSPSEASVQCNFGTVALLSTPNIRDVGCQVWEVVGRVGGGI